VLRPVDALHDEEVGIAGEEAATDEPDAGSDHHDHADPAGQLLPDRGGPDLGAQRRHRLLLRLAAQVGLELHLELVEHAAHGLGRRLLVPVHLGAYRAGGQQRLAGR
jgi:hypothetical protein